MLSFVQHLGASVIAIIGKIGRASLMLFSTLARWPKPVKTFPLLLEQLFSVGVLSMVIIVVSGTFIGMVVALQSYHTLSQFGAESQLGPLLALSVIRELGPVVTGLLFAGRACSALTAEIGLMKATDQLDSMEMIGVDPLWRIISPRFWAGIISMPLLALIFSACAIWGGYLVGVDWLGTDGGSFWANMQSSVDFHEDIVNSIIKSVAFGIVTTWIAVYQGYDCYPTAEGIGRATTRTVVYGSLAVLGLDFILTTLMIGAW